MKKKLHFFVVLFLFIAVSSLISTIGMKLVISSFELQMTEFTNSFITTFASVLILYGVFVGSSLIGNKRRSELFISIGDAMRRIARGDFNVRLENEFTKTKNHPVSKFIEGINHMAVELNEIEQVRQEFISNVSHEIQSPLASISGFAKVLKRDELTREERDRYLSIIETESLRLGSLSDNLLKLTTIESTQYPFDVSTYRLDKQIRDAILSIEPQWISKSLQMDISFDELEIGADQQLLNQVWINLLTNSIKFTDIGGDIRITLRQRNNCAELVVTDTGIGIHEDEVDYIFDRFFKADKSRNRAIGGSGLGLSIVKKIIDMHGGEISVRSKLGEGTTFTILLPLRSSS